MAMMAKTEINEGVFRRYHVENDPVGWVDREGLFGGGVNSWNSETRTLFNNIRPSLGHSDFSGNDRFDYTREDRGMTGPLINPARHFRDLSVSEERVEWAIWSCNKEQFERATHQGQDYFAHYKKDLRLDPGNAGLRCRGYGHFCMGNEPDSDSVAWAEANEWTKKWLQEWDRKCGKCSR